MGRGIPLSPSPANQRPGRELRTNQRPESHLTLVAGLTAPDNRGGCEYFEKIDLGEIFVNIMFNGQFLMMLSRTMVLEKCHVNLSFWFKTGNINADTKVSLTWFWAPGCVCRVWPPLTPGARSPQTGGRAQLRLRGPGGPEPGGQRWSVGAPHRDYKPPGIIMSA